MKPKRWQVQAAKDFEFAKMKCELWNLKHPVGTLVQVVRDDGRIEQMTTRSKAWVLSEKDPVIMLSGITGCFLLERCTPISAYEGAAP